MLFIDFSTAYDKVIRQILYWIIKNKKILNETKLQLLQFIHQNIGINFRNKKCTPETGVPQGCLTSPSLFNIYIEELLDQIIIKFNDGTVLILAYADDLVFLIEYEKDVERVINMITKWAKINNMVINYKKSAIMPIFLTKKKSMFYEKTEF